MKKSWHRAKRGSSRQPYQWLKSLFRTISPHKIITVCGCPEHSPLLVSNAILNKCFISTVLILKRLKKRDIRKLNPALTDFLWIPDRNVQIKLVLTFLFLQLYVKKEKGRGKLSENFFWDEYEGLIWSPEMGIVRYLTNMVLILIPFDYFSRFH